VVEIYADEAGWTAEVKEDSFDKNCRKFVVFREDAIYFLDFKDGVFRSYLRK